MRLLQAVVVLAALARAQNAPADSVEGTVLNTATGAGVSGAQVVFFTNQSNRYETTSDAAGNFRIAGMAPGNYRTTVEKDGFASSPMDLKSFLASGVRVPAVGDPVHVDLKLVPLNTVTGRVFSPDGKPAAGVEVNLNPNITADVAVTDTEGRFTLKEIRPGSYTLMAKLPASVRPAEAKDGTKTAMVPTYYPSAADSSQAQQIVLQGQVAPIYEIQMQTAVVHRLRGIVVDQEGRPSAGTELTLFPVPEERPGAMGLSGRMGGLSTLLSTFAIGLRSEPRGVIEATVVSDQNGRFEFSAVRPGDWRINAESDRMRGAANVPVGRDDVEDLRIQIAAPFNFTGVIEWKADNRPLAPITLVNAENNEFVRNGFAESGQLLFENILPGRYKALPGPGFSAQIFLGEYEVTGQMFSLSAGSPPLRVVLTQWSGTVRGTVEHGEGATVALIPQRIEGVALGQTVVCGPGGLFELNEVSPGDYYIAAFDRMEGLSPSAAMLSLMPSRGTNVKVEERSATYITLSSISVPP